MSTKKAQTMQSKNKGFTLIEIMVVVTIIGILAAIAIPSYTDYVIRSRTVEATSTLSDLRVRMEQFFQDNRNFGIGGICGRNNVPANVVVFPTTAVASVPRSKDFNFSCAPTGDPGTAYLITATGAGQMAGFTYTINEANLRRSQIVAPAKANWRTTPAGAPLNCWVTSQGGTC